jgi:predicted nucleic-acid-binding protein
MDSTDRLVRAVRAYRDSKGDFADYLIREVAREAGCTEVATFDRALLRDDGFVSP